MGKLIFTTWNAQGGTIKDTDKLQVISDLVEDYQKYALPHIFAIQEAGANPQLHSMLNHIQYAQIWSSSANAKNKRCTLGILVPKDANAELSWIQAGTIRDIPFCQWKESIRLGCMHAISSRIAPEEVKKVIEILNLYNLPYILGGDMNSDPPQPGNFSVFKCNHPTHSNGNELDYFIASTSVRCEEIKDKPVAPSDHNPVSAIFEY